MATLYVSDSAVRCVLWALQNGGLFAGWIVNDRKSGVTFSTNLLAVLLPGILGDYAAKPVRLFAEVLAPPGVEFGANNTVTFEVKYRLAVFVETNREIGREPPAERQQPLDLKKVAVLVNKQAI